MKKVLLLLAAVMMIAACEKPPVVTPDDKDSQEQGNGEGEGGEGGEGGEVVPPEPAATLFSVTSLLAPSTVWAAGDELKIVSAADGSEIGAATLQSGAGESVGVFSTEAAIEEGTSIKFVKGKAGSVTASQERPAAGDKDLYSVLAAESGAVEFHAHTTMECAMSTDVAVVCVSVSSTEFASLNLTDVSLYSATAALCDGEGATDRVGVSFTNPAALSGTKEAWFIAKPSTEAADFYAVATMKGQYNGVAGTTVQIPVKVTGKTLAANTLTSIEMTGLTAASCAVNWYNPVCTRYIPIEGWCYGTENTILINPAASSTVTFDVRANGDFFNVMRHAKAPARLQCAIGDIIDVASWDSWTVEGSVSSENGVTVLSSLNPVFGRSSNAIASDKTACTGFFNLQDADGNVIWRFTFWASAYNEKPFANGTLMDRNVGGYDPATGTQDQLYGPLVQWGRPFLYNARDGGQTLSTADLITSLALSAANADKFSVVSKNNWLVGAGDPVDLWGNNETEYESKAGTKSIFDPCPKGWMVCCPAIFKEMLDAFGTANVYKDTPVKGFYYTYNNEESCWPMTKFRDRTGKVGSAKACYFSNANCPTNATYGSYCEGAANGSTFTQKGANKVQASGVRCMKDTANR